MSRAKRTHRPSGPDLFSAAIAVGYDAIAEEYARRFAHELDEKPFDREFLDGFSSRVTGGPILDLGCGPGHIGRYLGDRGHPVCGVDISAEMVRIAGQLHPGFRVTQGDLRHLDFKDGAFAGIVSFYSIIHLGPSELAAAFAEMKRVLAPGGLLALAFHVGSGVLRIDELWGVKTSLDLVFFEPAQIMDALESVGLKVMESTELQPYERVEYPSRRCYLLAKM